MTWSLESCMENVIIHPCMIYSVQLYIRHSRSSEIVECDYLFGHSSSSESSCRQYMMTQNMGFKVSYCLEFFHWQPKTGPFTTYQLLIMLISAGEKSINFWEDLLQTIKHWNRVHTLSFITGLMHQLDNQQRLSVNNIEPSSSVALSASKRGQRNEMKRSSGVWLNWKIKMRSFLGFKLALQNDLV